MNVSIIQTGDKELDALLATMTPQMQKKAIRTATRDGAKFVLRVAKRLVPVDEGDLERSLTVRTAKGNRGKRLDKFTLGHAVSTREGMFQGGQFYGGFIEYGTKQRQTVESENRGRIEEDSFMRQALFTSRRQIEALFKRKIKQAANTIKAKA